MRVKSSFPDQFPFIWGDSAAAIIEYVDGSFLLQLRDDNPDVVFPGRWGLFGGALDSGEEEMEGLLRELAEELSYRPDRLTFICRFHFDLSPMARMSHSRAYFHVTLTDQDFAALSLGEGADMRLLPSQEILSDLYLTPYDHYALWAYINKRRIPAGG